MITLFNELTTMQTNQYLSASNDSRPSSFHQEALVANGNGVVYRVAHMNNGVGVGGCNAVGPARPISRQSTYHNRLSYRAFGSPPSTSTHGTSQSTGFNGQSVVTNNNNNGVMTASWPNNNGTLTNNGWINLALDSDPYQNHVGVVAETTLEKSFSKSIQNGTINRVNSNKESNCLHQNGASKHNGVGSTKIPEPRLTVSNHQIYATLLSLVVVGFPACVFSILAFQLLTTLSCK